MVESIKALVVVLAIALTVFRLAKPVALRFTTQSDFSRRRNIWIALTIVAFLSPNFWIFAIVAIPVFVSGGRKDSNPVAFYLLLFHVIPDIPVDIPTIGIQKLFWLNNYRLLSFCVLIPAALRLRKTRRQEANSTTSMDICLLGYGAIQILLYVPEMLPNGGLMPDSATNFLRRTFLFFVDTYVLYYVVSRSCRSKRAIADAQAAFCIACGIMALVCVFEALRHWLLYTDMAVRWGSPGTGFYYLREGSVRAQASGGHPLATGYLLAIAIGFWMYLRSEIASKKWSLAVLLVLWAGLLSTFSRGPWVGAVAIYFVFSAMGSRALSRTLRAAVTLLLVVGVMSLTPFGEKLINSIPFLGGNADHESVGYRQSLAERAWTLIQEHPILGDQLALTKMQEMRQGEGIIDLVNTYAQVGLFYGLVGLSIFVGFILIAFFKSYRFAKRCAQSDPSASLLGISLSSCIAGTLLMISGCSFILGVEKMYYVLAGLAAAYVQIGKHAIAPKEEPRPEPQ